MATINTMDSLFKIAKSGKDGILVTGLELDNNEYLSDDSPISTRYYKYEESITLNVLLYINSKEEFSIIETKLEEHNVDCIDESYLKLPKDGLYQVTHIILPTNVWLDNVLKTSPEALDIYSGAYYVDTTNYTYRKYGYDQPVLIEEILEVNSVAPETDKDLTTTIIRSDKNTFLLSNFNDCYYNICIQYLNTLTKCPKKDFDLLKYYRDIMFMTNNVIKYLIERKAFFEALRILEEIMNCNGICNNKENKDNYGCGCVLRGY